MQKYSLLLAFVLCFVVGCSEKITPDPPPTPLGGDHITLGQTDVVLSGPSVEGSFSFTAAQSWSIEFPTVRPLPRIGSP